MGFLGKMFGKGGVPPPPEPIAEDEDEEDEEDEETDEDQDEEAEEPGQQGREGQVEAGGDPSAQDERKPLPADNAAHFHAAPHDPSSQPSTARRPPQMEPAAGAPPELEISPETLPEPSAPAHQVDCSASPRPPNTHCVPGHSSLLSLQVLEGPCASS